MSPDFSLSLGAKTPPGCKPAFWSPKHICIDNHMKEILKILGSWISDSKDNQKEDNIACRYVNAYKSIRFIYSSAGSSSQEDL